MQANCTIRQQRSRQVIPLDAAGASLPPHLDTDKKFKNGQTNVNAGLTEGRNKII